MIASALRQDPGGPSEAGAAPRSEPRFKLRDRILILFFPHLLKTLFPAFHIQQSAAATNHKTFPRRDYRLYGSEVAYEDQPCTPKRFSPNASGNKLSAQGTCISHVPST